MRSHALAMRNQWQHSRIIREMFSYCTVTARCAFQGSWHHEGEHPKSHTVLYVWKGLLGGSDFWKKDEKRAQRLRKVPPGITPFTARRWQRGTCLGMKAQGLGRKPQSCLPGSGAEISETVPRPRLGGDYVQKVLRNELMCALGDGQGDPSWHCEICLSD